MGDQIYMQGHAAPGAYARAYLEGRLDLQHIMNFRQEVTKRCLLLILMAGGWTGSVQLSTSAAHVGANEN